MWVIGYGSTLSIGSLAQTDRSFADKSLLPVGVAGWERSFMVPSKTWGGTVLGVQSVAGSSWFNAVLIEVPTDEVLAKLDSREVNYDRLQIPPDAVTPYYKDQELVREVQRAQEEPIYLYIPKPGKVSYREEPSRGYLRVCASGAYNHGASFMQDFMATTRVGPPETGGTLLELISDRRFGEAVDQRR